MVTDCTSGSSNAHVGCRIECDECYGTVRYVGPVDGHTGTWLGVEWDNPSRGRHDGSVAGKRYFQTDEPTAGSFVRPGKVQLGRSAVLALTSRYGQKENGAEAQVHQLQLLDLQKKINAPFLTMVGFDKINQRQSKFEDLHVVSLRMQLVNGPGEDGELLKLCPNVRELDLSRNLFHDWATVFSVCAQLAHLHWLNLSENRLQLPECTPDARPAHVRTLICGHMGLSWPDVLRVADMFPGVQELRLPHNALAGVVLPPAPALEALRVLDLEGNRALAWQDALALGALPGLEHLNLAGCAVAQVRLPCAWDAHSDLLAGLTHLVLSENLVADWRSVAELHKLRRLRELRFLKNPVLESESAATCVQLVIARLGRLAVLNGTAVKDDERRGAEYDYIKKHGREWLAAQQDPAAMDAFCTEHPRYPHLVTKYGAAEESELVVKAQSLKTSLTAVEIHFEERAVAKKLPPTMTVQKLTTLVQKLFRLVERPRLYYVSGARPDLEVHMADEFKDISFYSVQDGDRILARP